MTHPPGIQTYFPRGQYNFPRSYVRKLRLQIESHLTYVQTDNEFVFQYSPLPAYRAYLKLRDEFWLWNSNTYSLDFIVEWAYQTNFPGDTETSFAIHVGFYFDADFRQNTITLDTVLPTLVSFVDLPPRTAPYWLPDL